MFYAKEDINCSVSRELMVSVSELSIPSLLDGCLHPTFPKFEILSASPNVIHLLLGVPVLHLVHSTSLTNLPAVKLLKN